MKFLIFFAGLVAPVALSLVASEAGAQTKAPSLTIGQLLNQGYQLKAASSNGQSQFLYFQGADHAGRKQIYACQLQFGSNGGFQGCLALP